MTIKEKAILEAKISLIDNKILNCHLCVNCDKVHGHCTHHNLFFREFNPYSKSCLFFRMLAETPDTPKHINIQIDRIVLKRDENMEVRVDKIKFEDRVRYCLVINNKPFFETNLYERSCEGLAKLDILEFINNLHKETICELLNLKINL